MEEKKETALVISQDQTLSPLVQMAMSADVNLDRLDKLITIQERFEEKEAKKEFYKAFSMFKKNAPVITKDSQVRYDHKDGAGSTSYKHASLANVMNIVTPLLSAEGLAISWLPVQAQNGISVTAILSHVLGYSVTATLSGLPDTSGKKNSIQSMGSTITYLQRYTALALLGLATKDDDGQTQPEQKPIYETEVQAAVKIIESGTTQGLETLCRQYKADYKAGNTGWTPAEWKRLAGKMVEIKSKLSEVDTSGDVNASSEPAQQQAQNSCGF